MFQIWYQVTAVIWFILAVTVIILLIRLLRLNKLKNEVKTLEGVRKYGLYMHLFRDPLYYCRLCVCLRKRTYSLI